MRLRQCAHTFVLQFNYLQIKHKGMKPLTLLLTGLLLLGSATVLHAQKAQNKQLFTVYNQKKFWSNKDWAFTKIALHFKVITSETAIGGKRNQYVDAKSWAMLNGVSEETMKEIEVEFTKRLRKRLESELGVTTKTWNDIKDLEGSDKVKDKEDPKTHMKKSEGAAVIVTADDGPFFHRVGGFPAGGKKLGKSSGCALIELDVILDFAIFETSIASTKDYGWNVTTINTRVQQGVAPVVFVSPMFGGNMDMRNSKWTGATTASGIYTSTVSSLGPIKSDLEFASEVSTHSGEMPAIMKRKFNLAKPDMTSTFVVETTDAKYKAAALDALDQWIEGLIVELKAFKK